LDLLVFSLLREGGQSGTAIRESFLQSGRSSTVPGEYKGDFTAQYLPHPYATRPKTHPRFPNKAPEKQGEDAKRIKD